MNTTVTVVASQLLEQFNDSNPTSSSGNNVIVQYILQWISKCLDDNNAHEWNLRYVAVISFLLLGVIRYATDMKYNVDWCGLIHAIITGSGACICWYLDTYYATAGTSTFYPTIVASCLPPLTSLHRILPAITLGYSLLDFIHGLSLGMDFIFHGAITMISSWYMLESHIPHIMSAFLVMECSTVFLTLIRASFFNETATLLNMACFVLSFFIFRCLVCPYLWYHLMMVLVENYQTPQYTECFYPNFMGIIFVFGVLFHTLNAFWMYKIIQKVIRKISGKEKVTTNNDLSEERKKKE